MEAFARRVGAVLRTVMVLLLVAALCVPQMVRAEEKEETPADNKENTVTWLAESGFIDKEVDTAKIIGKPSSGISRQSFVAVLMLAAGVDASKYEDSAANLDAAYSDSSRISPKLRKYMSAAYQLGVLELPDEGAKIKLRPTRRLTMQMAAYYVGRCLSMHIDLPLEGYTDYQKINEECKPYVTALVCEGAITTPNSKKTGYKKKMKWEAAGELIKRLYEGGYFASKDVTVAIQSAGIVNDKKAGLMSAGGVARDGGSKTLYVVDTVMNQIKFIKNKKVSVLTGVETIPDLSGEYIGGYTDGSLDKAVFNQPTGLLLVKEGLLVTDTGNNCLRLVNLDEQTVTTYAGNGKKGATDGSRLNASFNSPSEAAIADDGAIYIADTGNNCIRKIDANGNVTTFAGQKYEEGYKDGSVLEAQFSRPTGIAVSGDTIYVADCGNQRIRMIKGGNVTTIAGSGKEKDENFPEYIGGFINGAALKSRFNYPTHIAVGKDGELYISDTGNGMIRKLKDGQVTTVAGFGNNVLYDGFDWPGYLENPGYLMYSESNSRLYVADSFLQQVDSFAIE